MECQECHHRPATLHFTQVINGAKTEIHVCDVCAKEKGYMVYPEDGYSLQNLLSGLFNYKKKQLNQQNAFKPVEELTCPHCDLTFSRFQRIGKFGCSTCYDTFSKRLPAVFRRVHSGNTKHFGKIPKRTGGHLHTRKQIAELKGRLERLIEEEAFEQAAEVRDEIRSLQSDSDGKESDGS